MKNWIAYSDMRTRPNAKLLEKKGYHQGDLCYCENTTRRGSYRDEVYYYDGKTYYYYHQNLIMIKEGNIRVMSNCGWATPTTKKRLNEYLPYEYYIYQENFEWFIKTPEKTIPFYNDMVMVV